MKHLPESPNDVRHEAVIARPTKVRFVWAAGLALLPIGCAFLYANNPEDVGFLPPCPFRALTGFDCPGCGTGRAMHYLLNGSPATAFGLNPLAFIALPFVALLVTWRSVATYRGWSTPRWFTSPQWVWAVCASLILFWIARNLPFEAVSWMASYR